MTAIVDRNVDQGSGRRLRVKERRLYSEELPDEEVGNMWLFSLEDKLTTDRFTPGSRLVTELTGDALTVRRLQTNGFATPILVKGLSGLGMKVPDKSFGVEEIRQCVGSRRMLDVMDTMTQTDANMSMRDWCKYWAETPRTRRLNVISLEFSHTKLDNLLESPAVVRHVDWVDHVWPKHLKESHTESTNAIDGMKYPKVQKYVLMSVAGCYTDFHIDFGGTSVWYHILTGQKVFWLIAPSEKNIQLFEQWVLSGKQSDIFFGDIVDQCFRVELSAGDTFFIPSGYIHAVYTPEDSIVFGGNFLHSYAIEKQLRVSQVEDTTRVPAKFRFPFYTEIHWYLLQRYVHCLTGKSHLKVNEDGSAIPTDDTTADSTTSPFAKGNSNFTLPSNQHLTPRPKVPAVHLTSLEITGLKSVISWLSRLPHQKRAVPDLIVDVEVLLNEAKILVDDHASDDPTLATSGRLPLFWMTKAKNAPPLSLTAQLRQMKPVLFSKHHSSNAASRNNSSANGSSDGSSKEPIIRTGLMNAGSGVKHFAVQSSTVLNEMPRSFDDLIAASSASPATAAISIAPISTTITSSVVTSMMPSPPVTTSSSMQTLPLSKSAEAALANQQLMQTHQSSDSSLTPISVIPDQAVKGTTATSLTQDSIHTVASSEPTTPAKGAVLPDTFGSGKSSASNDSCRRRRTRCKKCESCVRADCGECHFCKDMRKFGGPGRMKQSCLTRQCMTPVLPHTACCSICGRDGWEKLNVLTDGSGNRDENQSSLMECSQCWEIVHPVCLKEKNPALCLESGKRDDLPNSWECPRCVAAKVPSSAIGKAKSSSTAMLVDHSVPAIRKSEAVSGTAVSQISTDKGCAVSSDEDDVPPPEADARIKKMSSGGIPGDKKGRGSFVKSCARFSLPHESPVSAVTGKKDKDKDSLPADQQSAESKTTAPKRKKREESLKDRFMRSLKTLRTTADPASRSSPSLTSKTNMKHKSSSPSLPQSPFLRVIDSPISGRCSAGTSPMPTPIAKVAADDPAFDSDTDEEPDPTTQTTADSDTMDLTDSDVSMSTPLTPPKEENKLQPGIGFHGKPLIMPMYVVRPAPIPQDCIESDDNDDDDEKKGEDGDTTEDDEEDMIRKKKIKKHLRNFRRTLPSNRAMERDVILPAMLRMSRNDVLTCSQVCKAWNAWATDPDLWPSLSASGKKITPAILVSIVRRQPMHVDLSWSNVSHRQMLWLLPRVPQLHSLSLSGCSASAVSALTSCNTPLLKSLDVSWVDAMDEDLVRDLTSSPPDRRPGLAERTSRLRLLTDINVAGCEVTDGSARLISSNFQNLTAIDVSNCSRLTDAGIAVLVAPPIESKLTTIALCACDRLTDKVFEPLKKCTKVTRLDLRHCANVSVAAFTKYCHMQSARQHGVTQAQNKLMCLKK